MMRDIFMALVLLALATIPIASWIGGGQPSVSVQKVEANLGR
jgi:hypothetical protein